MKLSTGILFLVLMLTSVYPATAGLFNAKHFTLKNGLQVYVIENPRSPIVSQLVCYKIGAADDPLGKSGLAHYLEHMMFKGPEGSYSSSIMGFVDNIGGEINAMTWVDWTIYYEIVPQQHLEKVMQMESDRMKELKVLPDQAIPELKVITEERKMAIGNDPHGQFAVDVNAAFYRHHPYKNPTIGWEHEILTYTPDDVRNEHDKWYAPNNAILILSGHITLEQAKKLTEKYYGPIPAKTLPERKRVVEPPLTDKVIVETTSDKIDVPSVVFSFRAPNHHSKDIGQTVYALEVLSHALGGSMNSYLYHKLVEERKVASDVSASYQNGSLDPQNFNIKVTATPNATISQVESALREELQAVIKSGLSDTQVAKAKQHLLAGLDYIRDSLSSGADQLAQYLSVGVPLEDLENWPDHIKKVTPEEVNKAMRLVLDTKHYVIGRLIPDSPTAAKTKEKKE